MTTYLQTLMHFVKGILGAGIFSMGVVFRNGGMITALTVTPIIGILVLHCSTLLVRVVEFKMSEHKFTGSLEKDSTYADIVERVFLDGPSYTSKLAKYMKNIVNVEICFMNLGFCCIYIIFVGNNMQKALQYFNVNFSVYVVMLIFILPMWFSSLITNLEWLAPVSVVANIILATALGIIFYFICDDLPKFSTVSYVTGIGTLPLFLSGALYAFDSIALVLALRSEMDHPEKMVGLLGILNAAFLVIVIPVVMAMGCFSYWKYGDEISGTVFLNLPDNRLGEAVLILACIQVLFSYPVQVYVPVTIIWPIIENKYGPFKKPLFALLCFRTLLVVFTLIISEAIPVIDLIISLIGAVCSTCLSLFFPALMESIVFYSRYESKSKKIYSISKNVLIILFAIVVFITGIVISVKDIASSF